MKPTQQLALFDAIAPQPHPRFLSQGEHAGMARATVLRGDARNLPLPDASVDLIVTSPPYWALRSYTDSGEHYDGQIGSEPTPAAYIATLLACTREWMRVLKPTGSLMVNLGDKYANDAKWGGATSGKHVAGLHGNTGVGRAKVRTGIPPKSLMGLPWRYALGCIDQLGLILRAEMVWNKPNGLPEPVTDRVRRSHEQWFHLVKQPRYFAAIDEIREPHTGNAHPAGRRATVQAWESGNGVRHRTGRTDLEQFHPLGKLPGSVWSVASEPLRVPAHLGVNHFAAFPTGWPKQLILGWSPSSICVECGEGRLPVVDKPGLLGGDNNPDSRNGTRRRSTMDGGSREWAQRIARPDRITGYACACPDTSAPTRPATVLDPFGGTGTTAMVAKALGRHGISVDRSADYCRLAQWRTTDPVQLAKARTRGSNGRRVA